MNLSHLTDFENTLRIQAERPPMNIIDPKRPPMRNNGYELIFDYMAVSGASGNPYQYIEWSGKSYYMVDWNSDLMEVAYREVDK